MLLVSPFALVVLIAESRYLADGGLAYESVSGGR